MGFNWLRSLDINFTATTVVLILPGTLALVIAVALVTRSRYLANDGVKFGVGKCPLSILYQHYRFVVNGPALIKVGYDRFSAGLFEIPRTFHFGQVILCKPELIEELKNTRSVVASPEPWIDQLLQISHVIPGYFPRGGGWPAIAKTTSGLIRGTAHKQLDRYIPHISEAIFSQLGALKFRDGECAIGCFDLVYSIVARSGSFAMVWSRLSQNEEYIQAVKDHILGMIVTTRVQFLVPDCLKNLVASSADWLLPVLDGICMPHRKILLKHFDARAAEYRNEMNREAFVVGYQTEPVQVQKQVEIFRWLYESSILHQKWGYSEAIGEMLLLQFAFIYTTAYGLYGALYELAQRPEYIDPLREEVEAILTNWEATVASCDQMILLDSFLKECQRMHPPAALSAHRVCVTALELSNGITLKPGTHVGVPSSAIQHSSTAYSNPEAFDGIPFAKRAAAGAGNTKLVDLSPDYLVFGMGVHACPGRWMASALMKLVLAHLLMRFDILPALAQGGGRGRSLTGSLSFEEFYVPNFGLEIRLRRRK